MAAGITTFSVNAQQKKVMPLVHNNSEVKAARTIKATTSNPHRTTAGGSRWLNAAESTGEYNQVDIYDQTLANFFYMWQDSSVRFPAPNNNFGISYQSIGQVFHPQSPLFNDPQIASNVGQMQIPSNAQYTVDSMELIGFYDRRPNSTATDTLMFVFVSETPNRQFAYFSYGGTVFADHGVDSFAVQLYRDTQYQIMPIHQISYSVGGVGLAQADTIYVPLTAAVFADSNANGTHTIGVAPNITVPAGRKISVSVTYISGENYTAGTSIDQYNNFIFLSHETDENGYVVYFPGDLNQSSVVTKDTTNANVNADLNMYVPSIAFTAPFAAELHNIWWKVSIPVSVNDISGVTVGEAYPNPANTSVEIPFSVKESATVNVIVTNAMGQVVKTVNAGKLSGGQSSKAVVNVSDLSSGVYFYTLEANGQRVTKRMVVTH